MAQEPSEEEIEARVVERADLVERLRGGDSSALVELLDYATGTEAASVKVTLPRPAHRAAG